MNQRFIMKKKPPACASAPGDRESPRAVRSFAEAAESPCASCPTAPCCVYLPVGRIPMETVAELDHARFLLNFRRIELGLFRTGGWEVFFRLPCRFLDTAEARCRIHDHPEQPRICRYYNPYKCWYKTALTGGVPTDFLRVDRQRLDAMLPRLSFDGQNRLVDVPGWTELVEMWAPSPLPDWAEGSVPTETASKPDDPDPPVAVDAAAALPASVSYAELADPCAGCDAWCCRALMLSHGTPASATSLDFLRFVLGFPGVSLGLSEDGWQIIVRTDCRHLTRGRCGLYGKPERPLECRYLDAWGCQYRLKLGRQQPPSFLEIPLDLFPRLVEPFRFDATGRITRFPSFPELKTHLETRPRSRAAGPRKNCPESRT